MPRIAVGGFHHETNTFAPSKATFADFEQPDAWPGLVRGQAVIDSFRTLNVPMTGFLAEARSRGWEVAPLAWASAGPSAHVTREAYERVAAMLVEGLAALGPVDAVYMDLHGAMVAEHLDDGEGELLRRVREVVGGVPVVASLDLHANVTAAMVAEADALLAYRTYPHLDMAETGARAARHLAGLLGARAGGATGVKKAFRKLPFLIPLTWQCTLVEPAKSLFALLPALESGGLESGGVASVSFTPGFPPADVPECGPAVMAFGGDGAAVEAAVDRLTEAVLSREADFAGKLWSPAEAVAYAMDRARTASRPVVLADTQDNPGAGANSDTVEILEELMRRGADGAALGLLYDPEAAAEAQRAGVGARRIFRLGTRYGAPGNGPLEATFTVEALSDGEFDATGPFYRGSRMRLGPMAVLRAGGLRVVLSSRKQQAADRAMFAHLGVEPAAQKILVLKSSVHFRADFQDLAEEVLVVEAPGPNTADTSKLPFRRLRAGVRLAPRGPVFRSGTRS